MTYQNLLDTLTARQFKDYEDQVWLWNVKGNLKLLQLFLTNGATDAKEVWATQK